jgi:hypothetical protein
MKEDPLARFQKIKSRENTSIDTECACLRKGLLRDASKSQKFPKQSLLISAVLQLFHKSGNPEMTITCNNNDIPLYADHGWSGNSRSEEMLELQAEFLSLFLEVSTNYPITMPRFNRERIWNSEIELLSILAYDKKRGGEPSSSYRHGVSHSQKIGR